MTVGESMTLVVATAKEPISCETLATIISA